MNRNLILSTVAMLALAACSDANDTAADADAAATDAAVTADAAPPATADATTPVPPANTAAGYATNAALSDMYEIESSRLALEKSTSPEVKQFAQMMIDGHTKTTADMKATLASAGVTVTPPAALDARRQGMLDELRGKTAAEFDTAYLDQQTAAHGEALDLHKGFAANGDNPQLKAFAATTAPVVQGHLDMVKKLDKTGADEPAANPPQ